MEALRQDFKTMSDTISSRFDRLELSIGDRIKEAVLEYITTVKNEFTVAMGAFEKRLEAVEAKSVPDLASNFVVYEMAQDENEDVKDKVNNLLRDVLKLEDVKVSSAERKPAYNGRDNGVIVAKCSSIEDRSTIMEAKSLLRDAEHYSHIRIYPDKPKWQRVHEANMRVLVKTLGNDKVTLRGNRVLVCDGDRQLRDFQQQPLRRQGQGQPANRGQGRFNNRGQGCENSGHRGRNRRQQ